ncbi:platelet glycoprotein Ib alpha chain-like isoform X2 [Pomacea canaliculata]|uniref:platelet glycoprotein Ib alpha chain-like isoform X2 n=1 Tax=Pomacea canaliculata TaxID=400727 RepID=UPI000D739DA3|nr:platelet glycoprotein Ib alpha chain-like isoform X2 [Pomacea canaliculata]
MPLFRLLIFISLIAEMAASTQPLMSSLVTQEMAPSEQEITSTLMTQEMPTSAQPVKSSTIKQAQMTSSTQLLLSSVITQAETSPLSSFTFTSLSAEEKWEETTVMPILLTSPIPTSLTTQDISPTAQLSSLTYILSAIEGGTTAIPSFRPSSTTPQTTTQTSTMSTIVTRKTSIGSTLS